MFPIILAIIYQQYIKKNVEAQARKKWPIVPIYNDKGKVIRKVNSPKYDAFIELFTTTYESRTIAKFNDNNNKFQN